MLNREQWERAEKFASRRRNGLPGADTLDIDHLACAVSELLGMLSDEQRAGLGRCPETDALGDCLRLPCHTCGMEWYGGPKCPIGCDDKREVRDRIAAELREDVEKMVREAVQEQRQTQPGHP